MEIVFVILFILSSQLVHSVAVDQQTGFNPYPFGTTLSCMAYHPLLLISAIFYLGWIWGIVLFLAHFFGIIHATISWVLDIPELLINNEKRFLGFLRLKLCLLGPVLLANLIFTVSSFFIVDFESLLSLFQGNPGSLIVIAIVVSILSAARVVVTKWIAQNGDI